VLRKIPLEQKKQLQLLPVPFFLTLRRGFYLGGIDEVIDVVPHGTLDFLLLTLSFSSQYIVPPWDWYPSYQNLDVV
jgi:hypothetical protein